MSSFVFKDEKHSGFHDGNHDDAMTKIQQKQQKLDLTDLDSRYVLCRLLDNKIHVVICVLNFSRMFFIHYRSYCQDLDNIIR